MFNLGAVYPAALNLFDATGAPVNVTTITLVITLPDLTTFAPLVQNPPPVTGQYTYAYITTQPGRHTVQWNTVNPVTSYSDVFDVAEAVPPSIISLSDAKQALAIPQSYTDDDDELRGKLMALTKLVEDYKHRVYAQRVITEFFNWAPLQVPWQSTNLRLTYTPVLALQSLVTLNPSGVATTTYDVVNNLYTDLDTGLVTVINGPPLAGRMRAIYSCGMTIIPYNIMEGSKVALQFLWQVRRGPGGLSGVTGPEELSDFRHYQALPRKVRDYLGPPYPTVM